MGSIIGDIFKNLMGADEPVTGPLADRKRELKQLGTGEDQAPKKAAVEKKRGVETPIPKDTSSTDEEHKAARAKYLASRKKAGE